MTFSERNIIESFRTIRSMLKYLFIYVFILFTAFLLSSNFVEEPSRRICNLSFIIFVVSQFIEIICLKLISFSRIICFVKVMTWTSGLTFTLILIFIVTIIAYNFIQKCCRGKRIPSEKKIFVNLIYLLENSFSFVEIIDSKFIGLFIFVFANILTGLVNLTMHPHERSEFEGYFIMCVYTFLSLFVPFFYYYRTVNFFPI